MAPILTAMGMLRSALLRLSVDGRAGNRRYLPLKKPFVLQRKWLWHELKATRGFTTPMSDLMPLLLVCIKILTMVVSVVFLVSGLDDVFIDVCYFCRRLYRRLFVMPKYQPLSEEKLLQHPEQLIAIMIPAWDESAVIRPMLLNIVRTLNYDNYHIIIGTYPNDLDTQREVDLVQEQHSHVHRITCPNNGPTNKADCLNWIYQGI